MQVIPHITEEIKRRVSLLAGDDVDVVITEVGGTVGDIEISCRFWRRSGSSGSTWAATASTTFMVTLVPFIGPSGEQKTKPTQHSVTELRSRGVQPDAIVCRCETPLTIDLERKISNLCDVPSRRWSPALTLTASTRYP